MSTQRLNTGRSAQFPDTGGGGGSDPLDKAFFTHNGLMPANTILEALVDFPAPSFEFGTSHVARGASAKFTSASPCNVGYNLGASYTKVLIIVGMERLVGFSGGPFIGQVATTDANPPQGYFVAGSTADHQIFKTPTGGGWSSLAIDTSIGAPGITVGQAFYYNQSTGRLASFVRFGSERWIWVLDITDASFTAQAINAGVVMFTTSPTWIGCPIGIYAE